MTKYIVTLKVTTYVDIICDADSIDEIDSSDIIFKTVPLNVELVNDDEHQEQMSDVISAKEYTE